MKKSSKPSLIRTIGVLLVLLQTVTLKAQTGTSYFRLITPGEKVANSLYNKVQYLDSRVVATNMGIVRTGAFNKKAFVKEKQPFAEQFAGALSALTDATAKEGTLLVQLRRLYFTELTERRIQEGTCHYKATLYGMKNGLYQKINDIDTVIHVQDINARKEMFDKGSKAITGTIAASLLKEGQGPGYTYQQVVRMDSIEESAITLYRTDTYKNGAYYTYNAFKDQIPDDEQVDVTIKNKKIVSVKAEGGTRKLKPKYVYAVVHDGKPYIATMFGYYPLRKINNEFFFTGDVQFGVSPTNAIIAGALLGGVIGGAIAGGIASGSIKPQVVQIDHANGNFIIIEDAIPLNNPGDEHDTPDNKDND